MTREEQIASEANLEKMLSEAGLLHSAQSELPEDFSSVIFFAYPICKNGSKLPYQSFIGTFHEGNWRVRGVQFYPVDMNDEYEVITWAYIYHQEQTL